MRKLITFLIICLFSLPVFAQGYLELAKPAPRHNANSTDIEVTAVFSYTCGYCFNLEPKLAIWQQKLPKNVTVYRLPAAFNKTWEHFARSYYVMDLLKVTEQAHMPVFRAMHEQNANLASTQAMQKFLANYGVKADDFAKAYKSFGIDSQVARDTARLRAYEIDGVPALIINGKYVISGSTAGGLDAMLDVASDVINKLNNP